MKRSRTQFARLMALDRSIREGRYPNCLAFSREYEVSQKTVQRDIDFMRDMLGAPLVYDRVRKGFRYEDGNWFLPALSLSEGDVFAVLVAARALEQYRGTPVAGRLERVFAKLAALLPETLSIRPELMYSQFSFSSPPARPVSESVWVEVVRGLTTKTSVRIGYRSFDSRKATPRVLRPYHIANLSGDWYVFGGYPETPADIRQFAMARIQEAELTGDGFDVPVGFNPKSLLAGAFSRFAGGKPVVIRLLFDSEIADWAGEREWHPGQTLKKRRNGDVELAFKAAGLYEVSRWVLGWGRYARVLAPSELKTMVADEIRAMAERAG